MFIESQEGGRFETAKVGECAAAYDDYLPKQKLSLRESEQSSFHYKDLNTLQVRDLDHMFAAVSPEITQEVLKESMTMRRVGAISAFCDVDRPTAQRYLEKHEYNPEAVVEDIDHAKSKKSIITIK